MKYKKTHGSEKKAIWEFLSKKSGKKQADNKISQLKFTVNALTEQMEEKTSKVKLLLKNSDATSSNKQAEETKYLDGPIKNKSYNRNTFW